MPEADRRVVVQGAATLEEQYEQALKAIKEAKEAAQELAKIIENEVG